MRMGKQRGMRESFLTLTLLLILMLALALTGLVIAEHEQRRVEGDLNRIFRTVLLSDHIERDLLNLQLGHAQGADATPTGREQMARFEARLRSNVKEAESLVDTPEEGEHLEVLSALIEDSLGQIEGARLTGPEGAVDRMRVAGLIRETLGAADAFARLNREQVRADIATAATIRRALFLMRLLLAVMMAAIAIFVVRLSRQHYRALTGLRDAIQRFGAGDGAARAPESDVTELDEVAGQFNALIDQLARNDRERAVFLSSVAHDLRTPLSALQSAVSLLSRERTVEGSQKRVEIIRRQLDRLNRMVSDLQDAAGAETGNLRLRLHEGDLRTVIHDAVELFRVTSEAHAFECELPAEEVLLAFDETRIAQVLANLLSNAIKYSAGGTIRVRLVVEDAIRISVSDQGEGISPEEQAHLFKPFRRLPRDAELPGVGLGLSVTKRLVEAHRGWMELVSTPGAGSTFTVVLPLAGVRPEEASRRPRAGGPGPEALRH